MCNFEFQQLSTSVYYRNSLTAVDPKVKRHNTITLPSTIACNRCSIIRELYLPEPVNLRFCSLGCRGQAVKCSFILPELQIRQTNKLGPSKFKIKQIKRAAASSIKPHRLKNRPLQAHSGHLDYDCMQ